MPSTQQTAPVKPKQVVVKTDKEPAPKTTTVSRRRRSLVRVELPSHLCPLRLHRRGPSKALVRIRNRSVHLRFLYDHGPVGLQFRGRPPFGSFADYQFNLGLCNFPQDECCAPAVAVIQAKNLPDYDMGQNNDDSDDDDAYGGIGTFVNAGQFGWTEEEAKPSTTEC